MARVKGKLRSPVAAGPGKVESATRGVFWRELFMAVMVVMVALVVYLSYRSGFLHQTSVLMQEYLSVFASAPVSLAESQPDNQMTAAKWQAYEAHRAVVTRTIERSRSVDHERLCVVGAGNLNDIDLRILLRTFKRIDLLDIDVAALKAGLARQLGDSGQAEGRIFLHGGIDLLGVPESVDADEAMNLLTSGRVQARVGDVVGRSCDVAVGTCIVSQLALILDKYVSRQSLTKLVPAMQRQYLETLATMVKPNQQGVVLHISDLAMREDARTRSWYTEQEIFDGHMRTGHILPGSNPGSFMSIANNLDGKFADSHFVKPFVGENGNQSPFWSWCLTEDATVNNKCFVVYAIQWRRI